MIDNYSVSKFVAKEIKDEAKKKKSVDNSENMDSLIARELKIKVNALCAIIPNARSLIAPLLNLAYTAQGKKGEY